jgi:serine/threonine-protein kinase
MKICPICKSEFGSGEVFCPNDGSRLTTHSQIHTEGTDPNDPLIGATLGGRYKVIKAIGEGGMGIVYEAVHEVIEKKVAVKVLRDDFSKRPEVVARFRQEAKSASRIGHEHIVDISDFGETPTGQSYFVMEYLEGDDLANILAREGTLAPARAVNILLQCCKALGAAHAKGIVHRDMKPENIFLTSRDNQPDFVKIVDFGIAKMSDIETDGAPGRKLTKTGMIFGTPEYMSPEQAAGKPLDHRVDIYALGVILFETLTGRVPFVGDTFMGILTQHMFEEIPTLRSVNPNVHCSEELEMVIFQALTKDPDERFPDMASLARAIAGAMDLSGAFSVDTMVGWGEPINIKSGVSVVENAQTLEVDTGKRTGTVLAILGVAALLIAGGIGGYLAFRPQPTAANGIEEPTNVGNGPAEVLGDGETELAVGGTEGEEGEEGEGEESEAGAGGATEEVEEGPEMISIDVTTTPPGAEIMVGGEIVCQPSPCSFTAEAGQSLRIQAMRGAYIATRDLEPTQSMAIEMAMARRTRRHNANARMSSMMRMAPSNNDLKVPEIFRD